jgi:excisionase family DNA binding protein
MRPCGGLSSQTDEVFLSQSAPRLIRLPPKGRHVNSETAPERQRQQLLAALFGAEVPRALDGQLLRTADVAALFQVSERTVSEWARRGRIPSVRTPGGHRRYPADQVRQLLDETGAFSESSLNGDQHHS